MGQREARLPPDVPVRALFQDRAEKRLVLLAEAEGDSLADRGELDAANMVTFQERQSLGPRVVLAYQLKRPGSTVHLPDRLIQGVHRDRVLRIFLSQFHKPPGELAAAT